MSKIGVLLSLSLLCAVTTLSQQHQHQDKAKLLRGPDHISDALAQRLILLNLADESDGEPSKVHRAGVIARMGLDVRETGAFLDALGYFKTQYGRLVEQYNKEASKADDEGTPVDYKAFEARVDKLVSHIWGSIESNLSDTGVDRLRDFVNREKSNMARTAQEGEQ